MPELNNNHLPLPLQDCPPAPFWRTIFSYLKPYRRRLILASVLSALAGFAIAWQALVIRYVVDFGINRRLADGTPVFNGLSCAIPDGQSVVLVGPSGSGKTTFVNLLLRLYDPQRGRVRLYGDDLYHYALKDLRSSFGVVTQDPFFFQASVLENIRVVRPEATEAEVLDALRLAEAADFVREMPQGVHTPLGENGHNLSGGQKQRLAIARAILAKSRFFIFDEATSALDNVSEVRIQKAMESLMKGHTTIIIAHRLSTIRNVNRVLVFQNGSIIQDGSFADLARQPNLFKTLLEQTSATLSS